MSDNHSHAHEGDLEQTTDPNSQPDQDDMIRVLIEELREKDQQIFAANDKRMYFQALSQKLHRKVTELEAKVASLKETVELEAAVQTTPIDEPVAAQE